MCGSVGGTATQLWVMHLTTACIPSNGFSACLDFETCRLFQGKVSAADGEVRSVHHPLAAITVVHPRHSPQLVAHRRSPPHTLS